VRTLSEEDVLLGSWLFEVKYDWETKGVYTEWSILAPNDDETLVIGDTAGGLAEGILDAYERKGITCPLVLTDQVLAQYDANPYAGTEFDDPALD
jgi:hypothetical protein